jgi:cytochrome b561
MFQQIVKLPSGAGAPMHWCNSTTRYGSISMGLHWLTLLLLVAVYACINLNEAFPRGSDARALLKTWHYMLGLSVLVLVALRFAANVFGPVPRIDPLPPAWQRLAAKSTHVALYTLMIVMPLLGWLILSAKGEPIPFFGLQLQALIGESRNVAEWGKEIHEFIGTAGYFVIGLHAAAALFHHYYVRDNTLRRMLPD